MRFKSILLLTLATFAVSSTALAQKKGKLELKDQMSRAAYAIGTQIGDSILNQGVEFDLDIMMRGIEDTVDGKKLLLDKKGIADAMAFIKVQARTLQMAKAQANIKVGKEYLAKNGKKKGVKTTKSGLQYEVLKEGKGEKPKATSRVKVHYKGALIDGSEFDSSYSRNKPAEFPLNGVIPGWTEGLQLMPVGSKFRFHIPSALAYGKTPRPKIPGNSVLVFEVELLEIKKEKKREAKKTN